MMRLRGLARRLLIHAAPTEPPPRLSWIDRRIAELEHDEVEAHIEKRIRARILTELETVRHRDRTHPATPDTYFWGITTAERIIRGERP